MIDRNALMQMQAQNAEMKTMMRTTVALDVLRLPIEDDVKHLRAVAIETLYDALKKGE